MALRSARSDTTARSRDEEMSDRQLVGFLGRKINQAMNDESGDLSDVRQDIFDRYNGDLYGNERAGYSKFTTREVLETVEWAKPALLRIFLGSDRVVAFDPVGADDEDIAAQETDVVNYKILKSNNGDGFIALYNFITDALMMPNAYIKAYVEEEEKSTTSNVGDVPAEGVAALLDNDEIEILEQDSKIVTVPMEVPHPEDPTQMITQDTDIEVFDLKYRTTSKKRVLKIASVPGEEALIDNDLTTQNIDHADFSCHRVRKSYSELVRQGYDPDELDDVGTYEDHQWNDERTNRLFYEDEDPDAEDEDDVSMRQFWVHECHVWVDYDGTGVAQFRRIVLIGAKVFENEETDYQPLVAMSSILVPHKHNGMSIAQLVIDLQELLTTLTRQLLDNIYRINIRRKIIGEDSLLDDGTTMQAMLNVQSEWIPVSGLAADAIYPETTQSIVGEILPVIQHVQTSTPIRTGITPENNVDSNVLQQATVGAFMGAMEKAGERLEMIARIMAETGFKQLFRKVHQLCRMYPDMTTTIKLRGEWIDVDPSSWQDRTDMTVNVGLGFNTKEQTLMLLQQILEMQKEALPQGLADIQNIYNTLQKLIESSGAGAIEQFFKDPNDPQFQPPPPPPPDPQMILAEAQAGALGQEQERKGAEAQHKGQMDQVKIQQDNQNNMLDQQAKARDMELRQRDHQLRVREADQRDRELDVREQEAIAGISNTNADTNLKKATTLKTVAGAGQSAAETERLQTETSDEVRTAREILDESDAAKSEGESEDKGTDGDDEGTPTT